MIYVLFFFIHFFKVIVLCIKVGNIFQEISVSFVGRIIFIIDYIFRMRSDTYIIQSK